jgi:hypothetical protein
MYLIIPHRQAVLRRRNDILPMLLPQTFDFIFIDGATTRFLLVFSIEGGGY